MIALPTFRGCLSVGSGYDPDAADYFSRIAAAGSSISDTNKTAVDTLIRALKTNSIWSELQLFVLGAGADSLAGAMVPVIGGTQTIVGTITHSRTGGLTQVSTAYIRIRKQKRIRHVVVEVV